MSTTHIHRPIGPHVTALIFLETQVTQDMSTLAIHTQNFVHIEPRALNAHPCHATAPNPPIPNPQSLSPNPPNQKFNPPQEKGAKNQRHPAKKKPPTRRNRHSQSRLSRPASFFSSAAHCESGQTSRMASQMWLVTHTPDFRQSHLCIKSGQSQGKTKSTERKKKRVKKRWPSRVAVHDIVVVAMV